MNYKKLLTPYKWRLLGEQLFHALLCGISVGSTGVFIFSLICHILAYTPPFYILISIGLVLLVLTFLFCILTFFRPGTKKTARRLDDTGLQDRISTMLEYSDNSSEIAAIQRADAIKSLNRTSPKSIPLLFPKKLLITALCSTLLTCGMVALPSDIFVKASEGSSEVDEKAQIIKDLLQNLREQAKDLGDSDEILDAITDIIDELEKDLANGQLSDEEKASKIDSAENKIDKILDEALTKYSIGEALQRYELTQKLGEVISDGDTDGVKDAMAELFDLVSADSNKLLTLNENVADALTLSGVDSKDQLYTALNTFALSLNALYTTAGSNTTASAAGIEEDLNTAFNDAESAIIKALEKQAEWEETAGKLDDLLEDAKDDILGIEKPEDGEKPEGEKPEDGEKPEGEKPEGEKPEGGSEGEEPPEGGSEGEEPPEGGSQGDFGEGTGEGTGTSMTETVYDPILGDVSYGSVYDTYYMDYIKRLTNGEIPEDMESVLEEYYNKLGNGDSKNGDTKGN